MWNTCSTPSCYFTVILGTKVQKMTKKKCFFDKKSKVQACGNKSQRSELQLPRCISINHRASNSVARCDDGELKVWMNSVTMATTTKHLGIGVFRDTKRRNKKNMFEVIQNRCLRDIQVVHQRALTVKSDHYISWS